MDQGELQLRESRDNAQIQLSELHQLDEVKLFSEYYNQSFTVKITHKHGDEIGGDIVETSKEDPMLGKRDIIHFKPEHVQSVVEDSTVQSP